MKNSLRKTSLLEWISLAFFLCSFSVFMYYSFNYEEAWYQMERVEWNYRCPIEFNPIVFLKIYCYPSIQNYSNKLRTGFPVRLHPF